MAPSTAVGLERELRQAKRHQLDRFAELRSRFRERYGAAAAADGSRLVEEEWRQRNRALEADVLPAPPNDFIRHPAVLYSMFVSDRCTRHELPLLEDAHESERPGALLEEDPVGAPPLVPGHDGSYATSSNLVHHAYHLERYAGETGAEVSQLRTFVEWGAGYGSMARLVRRRAPGATCVTIDTPLFACLQWLYLSSVLGAAAVNLLRAPADRVAARRVNVVPVGLAGELEVDADLFFSTWALNESAPAAQELVASREWFGARGLLLGMHDTDPFARRALAAGARRVPIGDFLPAQSYFVR